MSKVEYVTIKIAASDADALKAGPQSDYQRHGEAMRRLRESLRKATERGNLK